METGSFSEAAKRIKLSALENISLNALPLLMLCLPSKRASAPCVGVGKVRCMRVADILRITQMCAFV